MAHLLRKQIEYLTNELKQREEELYDWRIVGDCILRFYHHKEIRKQLEQTKYFILMATYKEKQAQESIKRKLDKILWDR